MKYFYCALFILLAKYGSAQQNLFNIPSGDITPSKKLFYQHQLNFYDVDDLESKSHLVYGLGRGWDAGINFIDLPLRINERELISFNDNSNRKPLYPLLMLSLQKQWEISRAFQINAGTQLGPNLSSNFGNKKVAYFNYALLRLKPFEKGYLLMGPYHTNNVFAGGLRSNQIGLMVGYEYKVTKNLLLMGDFISSKHKKSQTVLGAGYTLGNRVQLFAGALLAFPNRALQHGVVIELNLYGWDFNEKK
jgi:hypothetical protein